MTGRRSLPIPSYPTTDDAITNVVSLFDRVTGIVNVAQTTRGAICAKKMGIADIRCCCKSTGMAALRPMAQMLVHDLTRVITLLAG